MDITKIDKNFKAQAVGAEASGEYALPCKEFAVYGCWHDEELGFIKMPPELAKQISYGVEWGSRCTAGVRALFSTDSKTLKIKATLYSKILMPHMPLVGSTGFTLCEVEDGKETFVGNLTPPFGRRADVYRAGCVKGRKDAGLYPVFPLYSGVEKLTVCLDEGSTVKPYEKYKGEKPVLYYGSSITQGGCASRADNCYQALVSEWTNTDYLILGFSGNAKGEPAMSGYLKGVDCSVFVCDYDHNAPSAEHLQNTHLPLYLCLS